MNKDELEALVFQKLQADRNRSATPKSLEMERKLILATLDQVNESGAHNLNLEKVAKACQVTRPLLRYYFKTTNELIATVSEFVRLNYQEYVLSKMATSQDPKEMLETYLEAAWSWKLENPKTAKFWIVFLHQCTVDESIAKMNLTWTEMGAQRIEGLIKLGNFTKSWNVVETRALARLIQILLLGGLTSALTEGRSKPEQDEIYSLLRETIASKLHT